MTDRERNLAIITFAIVGFAAVVLLANKLIFGPASEAKQRIKTVSLTVEELRVKVGLERSYHQKFSDHIARSFGTNRDEASASSREFVMQMLQRSGLRTEEARTTPVSGTRLKNKAGYEIGWNVTVVGALDKLTNLLFLLQNDRHLFRLDDVAWSPVAKSTDVTLQFKIVTLVLDTQPIDKDRLPSMAAQVEDFAWFLKAIATSQQVASSKVLRGDDRKQYAMIADRDIFRPYIKKPPPPPTPRRTDPPTRTTNRDPDPPRPPRISYALVGLPQFGKTPEVMVKDSKSGKMKSFQVGQDLMGGEIVMIDYRGLPLVKDPERFSPSRVIIRIGRDLWAVELGDDLANKYRMTNERLPLSLRAKPKPIETVAPPKPIDSEKIDKTDSTDKTDTTVKETNSSEISSSPESKLSQTDTPSIDASTSKEPEDAP